MIQDAKIIIVDDDPAVRESLSFLLGGHDFDCLCYESGDALLLSDVKAIDTPILMDVRMPGRDGLETLQEALAVNGALKIIIMSGHADIPLAVRALKAGAVDFIEKPFQAKEIIAVLNKALSSAAPAPKRTIASTRPVSAPLSKLTPRELEIATLLVDGLPNKLIAYELGISVRTVETHRARLLSKLDIKSLSDLVKLVLLS